MCATVLQKRRQGYPGAASTNERLEEGCWRGNKIKSSAGLPSNHDAPIPVSEGSSSRTLFEAARSFPRLSQHLDISAEHIHGERNAPGLEVSEASIQVARKNRDLHSAPLERHSDEGVGNGTGYRSTKWPKRPRLRANGLTTIAQLSAQLSPLPAGPRLIYGSNGLCPSAVSSRRLSGMPPPP